MTTDKLVNAYLLAYATASCAKHSIESHIERQIINTAENAGKKNKDCSKEQSPNKL